MKISAKRLLRSLADSGFWLSWVGRDEMAFARQSHINELFEIIYVAGQGKRRQAVGADIGISVLHGRWRTKILNETQYLPEVGNEMPTYSRERQWTVIENNDDAIIWESQLASIAPARTDSFADTRGAVLLKRTEEIRRASASYVSILEPLTNLEQLRSRLFSEASINIRKEAARLLNTPGVLAITKQEGRSLYTIAILTLLLYAERVEGKPAPFEGKAPIDDAGFMGRIQLLVDLLARPERNLCPTDVEK